MNFQGIYDDIKSRKVKQAYIFHGKEEYVKDDALNKLILLLVTDFSDFNLSIMDNPSPDEIISAAEQLPMMDERRIVLVKNCELLIQAKKKKDDGKQKDEDGQKSDEPQGEVQQDDEPQLEEQQDGEQKKGKYSDAPLLNYLKNPNPSTVLVFFMRGKCDTRRKIYKAVQSMGGVVDFNFLSKQSLSTWLIKHAKEKGGILGKREAEHLVDIMGCSILDLTTELSKVLAYSQGSPVTIKSIDLCITPNIEQNIFHAIDAMLDGNLKKGLIIMRSTIENSGTGAEYTVLPAIAFRIRLLSDDKRCKKENALSRMFTEEELDDALVALADLDIRMKSEPVDATLMLERILLGLFTGKCARRANK